MRKGTKNCQVLLRLCYSPRDTTWPLLSPQLIGNKGSEHPHPSWVFETSRVSKALRDKSPNTVQGRLLQLFSFCEYLSMKPVCVLLRPVSRKAASHKGQARLRAELLEEEQEKGTAPCQLPHLLQAYANRPNKRQQH